MATRRFLFATRPLLLAAALTWCAPVSVYADGKVIPPRSYKGSLEEQAQEAIVIFNAGEKPGDATEDLILKISVQGEKTTDQLKHFAWVVPFPTEPETAPEDAKIFQELFNYVEARTRARKTDLSKGLEDTVAIPTPVKPAEVEVLSRRMVGSYEVSVVRENEPNALNSWLDKNGYQTLGPEAESILKFYREKGYVFACIKVSDEALFSSETSAKQTVDLHPLRFTFKTGPVKPGAAESTGARDGMYFPMKLSALQSEPFDVNLYVFMNWWVNDDLNMFGFKRKSFQLKWRDIDTINCKPDAGKSWDAPEADPFLKSLKDTVPTVATLFQRLHPGKRYYLTNIQRKAIKPGELRGWRDDLWLFPYYRDAGMVPYDARNGAPATLGWPGEGERVAGENGGTEKRKIGLFQKTVTLPIWLLPLGLLVGALIVWLTLKSFDRSRRASGQ